MTRQECVESLRGLCAWYEWSEPPQLEVASVLQDAADAVQAGELSTKAAEALIAVWAPFVGLEARVGNDPVLVEVAQSEEELQRHILADMRRMIVRQHDPAKKLHLTKLFEAQIERFAKGTS